MNYSDFLAAKRQIGTMDGFTPSFMPGQLFDFQQALVAWAVRKGRAALFLDCGMGKTLMQLAWAQNVVERTNRPVLILTPLAVGYQTLREGEKFGIEAALSRDGKAARGITLTNYEKLHRFDPADFAGVVCDESSIMKHLGGKIRADLLRWVQGVRFRLSCTATPAPNDHMEFGGQSEFLGELSTAEMLAMYFTHDGGDTSKWRLKGHARRRFWEWLAGWAVIARRPSDLGFDDGLFHLVDLNVSETIVECDRAPDGFLFALPVETLAEQREERRATIEQRCAAAAAKCAAHDITIAWCHLNQEGDLLNMLIPGAVQVSGSDHDEEKEEKFIAFMEGQARALVTKPTIGAFGLNFQHCAHMTFFPSHSFEQYYQAVRRCWRFGQRRPVTVDLITTEGEAGVLANLQRKDAQAQELWNLMVDAIRKGGHTTLRESAPNRTEYRRDVASGKAWTLHLGDCVEVAREIDSESVGFTMFSPPFSSLYTYSASERDMGNNKSHAAFLDHFRFLIPELARITMPGRHVAIHCFPVPLMKMRDGEIGLMDLRGLLIREFEQAGFIFHSEVTIWKDPVTQMQRTKALGLLHKTIRKDSAMSRMALPDYVITMRRPGKNPVPIPHDPDIFPVSLWQKYASPVWMDVNQSRTLNRDGARDDDDERHIAPLQLDVIERCLLLWSAPGDLVFSPFAGIGSEGYESVRSGRRFIGAELKESYWALARKHLERAESQDQLSMV